MGWYVKEMSQKKKPELFNSNSFRGKWNESKMKSLSLSTFGEKGVWLKDKIERQDDAAVNAASLSLAFSF